MKFDIGDEVRYKRNKGTRRYKRIGKIIRVHDSPGGDYTIEWQDPPFINQPILCTKEVWSHMAMSSLMLTSKCAREKRLKQLGI